MKKIFSFLVILASILFLGSCNQISIEQSGKEIIKEFEVKDNINELEIKDINLKYNNSSSGPKVIIKNGDNKSISIKMQESLQSEINLYYSSSKIIINGKEFVTYKTTIDFVITITGYKFNKIQFENAVICEVDNKTLEGSKIELELSGASQIRGNELSTDELDLDLSGASQFRFNKIESKNSNIKLSGASLVDINNFKINDNLKIESSGASSSKISGSSSNAKLELSGASQFRDKNFTCDKLEISLSGASSTEIKVNSEIKGNISGASTLNYIGNATIDVETSGASIVEAS